MSKRKLTPAEKKLKDDLIVKYRGMIAQRYENIIADIENTPVGISKEIAERLKDFFLNSVYPEPAKRDELDGAFEELTRFVSQPSLVWGLIGSLPMAILKFGAQLPNALKAGFVSLEAYTAAMGFEQAILDEALAAKLEAPISDEQFKACLRAIPRHELDQFIIEAGKLFVTISNTVLLAKTIEIMYDVIERMRKKPDLYSNNQIRAIQVGLDIMQGGHDLLSPYDEATKHRIVDFIAEVEREYITQIHAEVEAATAKKSKKK